MNEEKDIWDSKEIFDLASKHLVNPHNLLKDLKEFLQKWQREKDKVSSSKTKE